MLLWAEQRYNFEIYPAKRKSAMIATYEFLIKPQYTNVLKSIELDVRTKK